MGVWAAIRRTPVKTKMSEGRAFPARSGQPNSGSSVTQLYGPPLIYRDDLSGHGRYFRQAHRGHGGGKARSRKSGDGAAVAVGRIRASDRRDGRTLTSLVEEQRCRQVLVLHPCALQPLSCVRSYGDVRDWSSQPVPRRRAMTAICGHGTAGVDVDPTFVSAPRIGPIGPETGVRDWDQLKVDLIVMSASMR